MQSRSSTIFLALATVSSMVAGGCDGCGGCSNDSDSKQAGVLSPRSPTEAVARAPALDASRSDAAASRSDAAASRSDAAASRSDAAAAARADDYAFEHLWAGHARDGRVHIDLGGAYPFPGKQNGEVFDEGARQPSAPYLAELIREPFRGTTEVDVLTPDGPVQLAFDEVRRDYEGPGSGVSYVLVTTSSESLEKDVPDVVVLAPAGEMAPKATWRPADPKPAHAKAVPKLRRAVLGALRPAVRNLVVKGSIDELAPDLREELRYADSVSYDTGAGLDAEHFDVVEGQFAPPRTQFVAVSGREGIDGFGIEFDMVRATLFATQTGRVTEVLEVTDGPEYEWGHSAPTRAKPLALIDLDADGTEGVLYDIDGSIHWVDFADGQVIERKLD